MNWNKLTSETELETIKEESKENLVVIFKHSTRCPISNMTLERFETSWNSSEMENVKPYYLDILNYRSVSNQIIEVFNIGHESPQLLLIENGICTYDESHMGIQYKELKKIISQRANKLG